MVTQHQLSLGPECLIMGVTVMSCLLATSMWSTTTETMLEHIAAKLTIASVVPSIRQSVWLSTVSTVHFPVLVVRCYCFWTNKIQMCHWCEVVFILLSCSWVEFMWYRQLSLKWTPHLNRHLQCRVVPYLFLLFQLTLYKMTTSVK